MSKTPRIYEAVQQEGLLDNPFSDVGLVAAHSFADGTRAVIRVRDIPYENRTAWHANMARAASIMLKDVMENAVERQVWNMDNDYLPETDILTEEAFRRRITLEQEKYEKFGTKFLIAELIHVCPVKEAAEKAGMLIRITDCMGMDKEHLLCVLFSNTCLDDFPYIRQKFLSDDLDLQPFIVKEDPA